MLPAEKAFTPSDLPRIRCPDFLIDSHDSHSILILSSSSGGDVLTAGAPFQNKELGSPSWTTLELPARDQPRDYSNTNPSIIHVLL